VYENGYYVSRNNDHLSIVQNSIDAQDSFSYNPSIKKDKMKLDYLTSALRHWKKVAQEILYGLTRHELDLELKKGKGHLESLFLLVVCGDLVGLPVLPPYYSLRLLPYLVPVTQKWKRRLLREKDLTDFVAGDL
jgi:hypothetical protein